MSARRQRDCRPAHAYPEYAIRPPGIASSSCTSPSSRASRTATKAPRTTTTSSRPAASGSSTRSTGSTSSAAENSRLPPRRTSWVRSSGICGTGPRRSECPGPSKSSAPEPCDARPSLGKIAATANRGRSRPRARSRQGGRCAGTKRQTPEGAQEAASSLNMDANALDVSDERSTLASASRCTMSGSVRTSFSASSAMEP